MKIENRRIIELVQGVPEWHAHRDAHYNASDAAAMLGLSSYKTRADLIREKATGERAEIDAATQRRFDKGHEYEAIARPWAQELIGGEELYPVVMAAEVDGLPLSASLDGLTMIGDVAFEHKSLNEKLATALDAGVIPDEYKPQMEQGLLISGATKCLFMASNGNRETMRYALYESDPAVRAQVLAGWRQFSCDIASYRHAERAPAPVAAPVLNLPAVSVQVDGSIAIKDNFEVFEMALRDFVDNKLIREPQTDQDFADLDTQIKTLKKAEEALIAAENHVIAQVASIDTLKRTKDMLHKLARDNRLMAEKLLESEKTRRRVEIQEGGKKAFAKHIEVLNTALGKPYMPAIPADFVGVTKGLRSIASIQNAVDTELARAKIAADEAARLIETNLKTLREQAAEYKFLFADVVQLVTKANDDLVNVIKARIAEHKESETKRLEQERERIAAEERRKMEAAQEAEDAIIASIRANATRIEFDSVAYIKKAISYFESGAKDFNNDPRPRVVAALSEAREQMQRRLDAATQREAASAATITETAQVTSIASPVVEPVATSAQVERSSAPVFAASAARKPVEAPAIPQDPVYLYTAEASGNRVVVTFEAGRESLTIEEAKRLRSHLGAAILNAEAAA